MTASLIKIFKLLQNEYGLQNWWPIVYGNACLYLEEFTKRERSDEEKFEIAVGAILTQNTSWSNVVKVLIRLKESNLLNIKALKGFEVSAIANIIKPSGYYNQKAKKIKALIQFLMEPQNSLNKLKDYSILEARRRLLSVWGIGEETADSILLYAYHKPVFVVDAYTKRIFSRIGSFNEGSSYGEIQAVFHRRLPEDEIVFQEYHALIVRLGKEICRKEPLCSRCCLENICGFAKQMTANAHIRT